MISFRKERSFHDHRASSTYPLPQTSPEPLGPLNVTAGRELANDGLSGKVGY